ncbi:50S ribosomal protein L7/L12 [Patescibacteria group bacterium]|nr:50S ribosomal protein L7/L12 [Patescibacteria group bacterium]
MTDEEKKTEEKTDKVESGKDEKDVVVPEKFKSLIEEIEKMTVVELAELVKILEDKFGVSAAAPMMMAGGAVAGGEGGAEAEEKSAYTVELTSAGSNKIAMIKAVKEITEQGLQDAKKMVEEAPVAVKEDVPKEEAEEMKKKLEEAGATVTLK